MFPSLITVTFAHDRHSQPVPIIRNQNAMKLIKPGFVNHRGGRWLLSGLLGGLLSLACLQVVAAPAAAPLAAPAPIAAVVPAATSTATSVNPAPVWFSGGRPTADALEAVRLLQMAGSDGLNPDDYAAHALTQALDQAAKSPLAPDRQAELASKLTQAIEHYVSDLHVGRVAPRDVHAAFTPSVKLLDPSSYVRDAVAVHGLTAALRAAAPQLPLYANLRQALAHYRQLASDPALQSPLPPLPTNKLAPGGDYAGIAGLAQKLIALGDMAPSAIIPDRFDGALVDGVKAFQVRHGLQADGIIGRGTFAQLNMPMSARVRQIELTLERLRWTPLLLGKRMIVVNVPEFLLRAYEVEEGRINVKATMNVIVGKALDTRTPLFFQNMSLIEFSPYWNIPPSIARAETVPKLRRDPSHLNREGLEFVGANGQVERSLSEANLAAVLAGKMRIRQRPGPRNALGDIKFIFPNTDNIYLHHTPAPLLFKQNRRDFSHGCIRVEDPVALARFVLQEQPAWTAERIREAMEGGKSKTIRVQPPLPVVIAYATAIARADGKVHFFADIYGHDKLLDAALKRTIDKPQVARH
jgi:murein L,D-transpeptidase YcbB/YkuD